MNLTTILRKSWQMLWSYRALWLFGTVLALVSSSMIYYPWPWRDRENNDEWIKIKLTETATLQVPGGDMTIDLTSPEGIRIITPDSVSWHEFRDLVAELNRATSINLWPILIEAVVILAGSILLGTVARYLAETAVIRMVDETDETGKRLSVGEGLQRGWSFRAWRLFLLDLGVGILAALVFVVIFGLAVAPILLAIGSGAAILITAGVGAFGLLVLGAHLWLVARLLLSLVLQLIRRACVLEEQGLMVSIRQGFRMTVNHFKEVGLLWLIWMGIRLFWFPIGIVIFFLLAPLLLVAILAGATLGSVPAALVALVACQFTHGATPWIMGAMAGLPIFIIVMISPILFVNGFVEIYLSSMWTLAYRDLRAIKSPVLAPISQTQIKPAHGLAD